MGEWSGFGWVGEGVGVRVGGWRCVWLEGWEAGGSVGRGGCVEGFGSSSIPTPPGQSQHVAPLWKHKPHSNFVGYLRRPPLNYGISSSSWAKRGGRKGRKGCGIGVWGGNGGGGAVSGQVEQGGVERGGGGGGGVLPSLSTTSPA